MIGAKQQVDLVLGAKPQRLLLGDRWIALMINESEIELGAAEPGKPGIFRERNSAKLRMWIVDDLGGDLDGRLRSLPRRRRVPGQWEQNTDFHRFRGVRDPRAGRETCRGRTCGRQHRAPIHVEFGHSVFPPCRHVGRSLSPAIRLRGPADSFARPAELKSGILILSISPNPANSFGDDFAMPYDLSTITVQPSAHPKQIPALEQWLKANPRRGEFLACLVAEIGELNKVLLLHRYDSDADLAADRAAVAESANPYGIGEMIA